MLKPIIKLCGGKTRLLPTLHTKFPDINSYNNYVEPFLGGGSVFLSLLDLNFGNKNPKTFLINELNLDIVNLMIVTRDNVDSLIQTMGKLSLNTSKERFEEIKFLFNSDKKNLTPLDRAAFFLFLNKTCFNGLIRYNKSGHFNSPYGKYLNPCFIKGNNLKLVSESLQKIEFYNLDFEDFFKLIFNKLTPQTFVYLDPPYLPISETSSFTQYTDRTFVKKDHIRLRLILDELNKKDIKFLVSNSNSILTREVYSGYNIEELTNSRSISANSSSRGYIKELIIKNY